MSVNYHAFQNRGYLFSNHEVLADQWRSAFAGYDPSRISGILHLESDDDYLYLSYFQSLYRLRLKDGYLEKKITDARPENETKKGTENATEKRTENSWTEDLYFNETMVIYHLLHYTKDTPQIANVWVPNTALEGAGAHNRNLPDPLLTPFAAKFSGKGELLEKACQSLGGTKLSKGDVAYQFTAFPQIRLQLIFWDADEDFPAQVQILVDKQVTDFLHFETTGCIISDLLEMLEKQAK